MTVTIDDNGRADDSRRQASLGLSRQAEGVQKAADLVRSNRRAARDTRAQRLQFDARNLVFNGLGAIDTTEAWFAIGTVTAVYFVDLSIFAASSDYFAQLAVPASPTMRVAMRLVIPATVIAVDLWIGRNFWHARDRVERDPRAVGQYRRWAALAVLFVLLMPIFAGASAIAAVMASNATDIQRLLTIEGVGTAILALVTHGGLILGAQRVERAIALFSYRRGHRRFCNVEAAFNAAAEVNERECLELFQRYHAAVYAFNREFAENEKPGPFDLFTAGLINELMGREVVEVIDNAETA